MKHRESASAPFDRATLDELTLIALQASAAILAIDATGLNLRDKADRSPVTAADEASERVILGALPKLLPGVTIVSEEAMQTGRPSALGRRFVLVDPLDGTREFIEGHDDYTVNIALIDDGRPIAGVVAAPALGTLWRGAHGLGAERLKLAPGAAPSHASERTAIHTRTPPKTGMIATVSRSHPEAETAAYLERIAGVQRIVCGSSLKFCRVAEGNADIYPRFASLSEWDVAAGHAVLAAAGGAVTTADGTPLTYGRADFRLPPFIAWGKAP